jgi:hypothetical protein
MNNSVSQIRHPDRLGSRSHLRLSPALVEPRRFSISRAVRFGDRTHSQLLQLKRKLLREALEETPDAGLFKRLCGAANQAAALAWGTSYPLLVFPLLLEEMVNTVRALSEQERITDAQPSHASWFADLRFDRIHRVVHGCSQSIRGGVSGLIKDATRGYPAGGQPVVCHTS